MELGEDFVNGGALVGVGRHSMRLTESSRNVDATQCAIGTQQNFQHASRQGAEQMAAARALVAQDELTFPLAPDDRVRGYATPAWRRFLSDMVRGALGSSSRNL